MELTKTNKKDSKAIITCQDLNQQKIILADLVIENIFPLLDKTYSKKERSARLKNKELKKIKSEVFERKNYLESLIGNQNKLKKIKKLLDRIERLIEKKTIVNNPALKRDTTLLLQMIETLDIKDLDYQLDVSLKLLTRK